MGDDLIFWMVTEYFTIISPAQRGWWYNYVLTPSHVLTQINETFARPLFPQKRTNESRGYHGSHGGTLLVPRKLGRADGLH